MLENSHSDAHHCSIDNTRIAGGNKLSVLGHRNISVEHIVSRNLNIVEDKESVVFAVVSVFGANITDINAWKWLVCLHVSKLHHERLDTISLSIDNELSVDNSVVSNKTELTDPPFGSFHFGSVEDKAISFFTESCSCQEILDIRTVTKLSLSIATNDLHLNGIIKPSTLLLIR